MRKLNVSSPLLLACPSLTPMGCVASTLLPNQVCWRQLNYPRGCSDMLGAKVDGPTRRANLRKALAGDKILQFPGAFNPLAGKMIEDFGFDGVYISGAVMSA